MQVRYITRFFFSFIFLCGIFSNSRASVVKADSLFASGKYFEASIEYERAIFNSPDSGLVPYFKYRKALCYKQQSHYQQAIEELQPVYLTDFNDTLYQKVTYQLALCFFLNGDSQKALMKIEEYQRRRPDSLSHVGFLPLKGFCLNDAHRWDDARKCFQSYIAFQKIKSEEKIRLVEAVNQLYLPKELPKIKKENTAENLSRFIPGAGQIYAGETVEGILNLALNASVLAFAGYQIYYHYYITGYLAGLGLFNKTYHGGMKRAGVLASQHNRVAIATFNQRAMLVIDQLSH